MKNLLLRPKPCAILTLLKDGTQEWYPSKLAKNAGASYVYTTNLLSKFEKEGIVVFERKGKTKTVKLTEKGTSLSSSIEELIKKTEIKKEAEQPPKPPAA